MTKITLPRTVSTIYGDVDLLNLAVDLFAQLYKNGYINPQTGSVESSCDPKKLQFFLICMGVVRLPVAAETPCAQEQSHP